MLNLNRLMIVLFLIVAPSFSHAQDDGSSADGTKPPADVKPDVEGIPEPTPIEEELPKNTGLNLCKFEVVQTARTPFFKTGKGKTDPTRPGVWTEEQSLHGSSIKAVYFVTSTEADMILTFSVRGNWPGTDIANLAYIYFSAELNDFDPNETIPEKQKNISNKEGDTLSLSILDNTLNHEARLDLADWLTSTPNNSTTFRIKALPGQESCNKSIRLKGIVAPLSLVKWGAIIPSASMALKSNHTFDQTDNLFPSNLFGVGVDMNFETNDQTIGGIDISTSGASGGIQYWSPSNGKIEPHTTTSIPATPVVSNNEYYLKEDKGFIYSFSLRSWLYEAKVSANGGPLFLRKADALISFTHEIDHTKIWIVGWCENCGAHSPLLFTRKRN